MKQFVVVGLGNFGLHLATRLSEKGHDVMAIDIDQAKVQEIKDRVSRAVVADATDQKVARTLGLKDMDAAVICIGTEMGQSILATLTMKDIGVKRVLAMAISEAHGRILEKVGASQIFFPERDLAISMAERLHNPNILEYLPLIEGYRIIEAVPPEEFVGRSLRDLDLINRFGIQVIAIKEKEKGELILVPSARSVIKIDDTLILVGPEEALDKLGTLKA